VLTKKSNHNNNMTRQFYSSLSIMLLSNAVLSYGHQLLEESLPFPDDSTSLVGTNWQLKEINGVIALSDDHPELFFSSKSSLIGWNGCQQFGAEWGTLPSSSMITVDIDIGTIVRIRCSWLTDGQLQQERDFMSLLHQKAIAYSISEDEQELTLYRDDTPTMTLTSISRPVEPQPHERLVGTSWIATEIRGRNGTLWSMMGGNSITLSFSQDEVTGNGGCNQFSLLAPGVHPLAD
jgi:heat shock protein HslJ